MRIFRITGLLILVLWSSFVFTLYCYSADSSKVICKASEKDKLNFSGDNQYQLVSRWLPQPLRVQVLDCNKKPLINHEVHFRFINFPSDATGQVIDSARVLTDSMGIAGVRVCLGSVDGEYAILASIEGNMEQKSVVFKIYARKTGWFALVLFGLAGGLGLFLFGMLTMSGSLQKSVGSKMRSILSKLTYNRFIAIFVGAFVTMVIQSSSATLVMLVSFVNSRLIRFRQSIGIFIGAAIGSTFTTQIIAFKIADYALLFVGLGFFIQIISKKPDIKNIGESIFGFGILFFGMHIMSETMLPLRTYEPFIDVLLKFENPLLGIFTGALLTALVQSSAAFIGIMMVLATQGLLTLQGSIPLLIGANLGTAITAILASIQSNRESRQVALAFSIFKASGALILIWWIPSFVQLTENFTSFFVSRPDLTTGSSSILPRQIANAHTLYNFILAAVYLPFVKYFDRFINLIFPLGEEEAYEMRTRYLDESMIKTPLLALNLAKQEVLRMMEIVKKMTELILQPFLNRNLNVIKQIEVYEMQVNFLRDNINNYILNITREQIESSVAEESFQLMYAVKEFEQIADIVAASLKEKAISWCNSSYDFSPAGKSELEDFHRLTLTQINRAHELYKNFSLQEAEEMKDYYKDYRKLTVEFEKQHFERLKSQIEESLTSSKTHLELITLFKTIGGHATNTARILLKKDNKYSRNDTDKSTN